MSFIDVFQHKHVGFIADIPIYLPEQDISGEFTARANAILLGGGSGELSAWVLDPVDVLFMTVDHHLYQTDESEVPSPENYGVSDEAYDAFMDTLFPDDESIVYRPGPTWTLDESYRIVTRAMAAGYVEGEPHRFVENWLTVKVGERFFDTIIERCEVKFTESDMEILEKVRSLIKDQPEPSPVLPPTSDI